MSKKYGTPITRHALKKGQKVVFNQQYCGIRPGTTGKVIETTKTSGTLRYHLATVLFDDGQNDKYGATLNGRTVCCYNYRLSLNVGRMYGRMYGRDLVARAKLWAKHGFSQRRIAAKLGTSKTTVQRALAA